jgi:hypothetical protein
LLRYQKGAVEIQGCVQRATRRTLRCSAHALRAAERRGVGRPHPVVVRSERCRIRASSCGRRRHGRSRFAAAENKRSGSGLWRLRQKPMLPACCQDQPTDQPASEPTFFHLLPPWTSWMDGGMTCAGTTCDRHPVTRHPSFLVSLSPRHRVCSKATGRPAVVIRPLSLPCQCRRCPSSPDHTPLVIPRGFPAAILDDEVGPLRSSARCR